MFEPVLLLGGINIETLVGGIVFLLFGSIGVWAGVMKFRKYHAIRDAESVSIREGMNTDGMVSVSGKVKPLEKTFSAPFRDTSCVGYDYQLDVGSGDDKTIIDVGEDVTQFLVDDGSDVVAVDVDVDNVEFDRELIHDVSADSIADYVYRNTSIDGSRRYKSGILELRDDVTVMGEVTSPSSVPDADADVVSGDGMLIVSNIDIADTVTRFRRFGWLFSILGVVLTVVGIGILSSAILTL